jgi:integrase/recombinase XerD
MSTELATYSQAGALEALTLTESLRAKWLKSLRNENTRAAYRRDLENFTTWCAEEGGAPVAAGREAIDTYVDSMTAEGMSSPTIVRRLAALSSFYEYAIDAGAIGSNPTARVKRPKMSKVSPTLGLSKSEASAFIRAAEKAGPRDHALALLLIHNGLRVSEVIGFDVSTVRAERGHYVADVYGKGGKVRRAAIDPETRHALELATSGRETGPALIDSNGRRLNRFQVARIVTRLARAAGIENPDRITPHSCRHAYVTLALDAGTDIRDVQEGAGHGSPETTMRYDRARGQLDRSPTYRLAAYLAE